jgi:hypothetical protein
MDGEPVKAIVSLPDFDKNFGRLVRSVERMEKPMTWFIHACTFGVICVGAFSLKSFFQRSAGSGSRSGSSSSSSGDKKKKDKGGESSSTDKKKDMDVV